jgi:hypothetical protein
MEIPNQEKKWTRAVCAIVLLGTLALPMPRIIKDMATGHPDAYPSKVANDALKAATRR